MKKILSLLVAYLLATSPVYGQTIQGGGAASGGGGSTTISSPLGSQPGATSVGVALAAPNTLMSAQTMVRQANTTTYAAGQLFGTSATAGSNTIFSWAIAPANGVPVYITKALFMTQTSGGAGVTITNGSFRLQLYGQSPTNAAADAATYSTTNVNWCGTLDGTLLYQGTDWSVAEMTPTYGSAITCTPGGSSKNIYGLIEARAAFVSTNAEVTQVALTAQ